MTAFFVGSLSTGVVDKNGFLLKKGSIINVGVIILNIYFFTKKEDKSKKTPYNKSA
jgi:hypothetical protein